MSEFLVNAVRRGAGRWPVVSPRREELAPERLLEEEALSEADGEPAEEAMAGETPHQPPSAVRPAPSAATPVAAPWPTMEPPSTTEPLPVTRPERPAAAAADIRPPARPRDAAAADIRPPAPPRDAAPRMAGPPQAEPAPREARSKPARSPEEQIVRPAMEWSSPLAAVPPAVVSAPTATAPPSLPRRAEPELRPHAQAPEEVRAIERVAPVQIQPSPLPAAASPMIDATPEPPHVEVRIGRVEILPAPLAPPLPAPRRQPRGFADQASARSYRDRRWY